MSHTHYHIDVHFLVDGKYQISSDHIEKHFAHSHGHGGQNVNKVATKVQLKMNFDDHSPFPQEINEFLQKKYPHGLEVQCQKTRHQHKNLEIAMKKMKHQLEEDLVHC